MKPDIDYTRRLLDAIEATSNPTCDTEVLRAAGFDVEEPAFIMHLRLLEDRGLIEGANRDSPHLYTYTNRGRTLIWTRMPLRMTATGHDFAASLRTPMVMETIKAKIGEAAFGVWVSAAATLASAYASKQLGLTP